MDNNTGEKPAAQAPVQDEIVNLNLWQVLYRFLMFCLLSAVIVFDIFFLTETNTDMYFDHFNVAISFLIIPFCLAFINNNFFHCRDACKETKSFNGFFGFFYRVFRLIGFEHFVANLFTSFSGKTSKTLDAKIVEANNYHAIFGSQIVMMTQLHCFFAFQSDDTSFFWFATPIILHACHIALLGAEIRQANKSGFMSFIHTFFHIDFLLNLFEGVGRAILVGATAMVIESKRDFDGSGVLTRQVFAIDALAAAGFCVLVIFYMLIKTGFISGLVYGVCFFFQLLGYRCDSNNMKLYNNFQRRLSNRVTDSQLRFQYYFGIIWRFLELIAIWAALLDNDDEVYNKLDNKNYNRITLRDALLVGLIFDAIYLAVLLVEFFRYCCSKGTFNSASQVVEEHNNQVMKQQTEQEVVAMTNKGEHVVGSAPIETEFAVHSQPSAPFKLPEYIDEEARDFDPRSSKVY